MLRSRFFTLMVILAGTLFFLAAMKQFSNLPNSKPNGFKRTWLPDAIIQTHQVTASAPLKKIIGTNSHHIYFSVPNPKWIIVYDEKLNSVDTAGFGLQIGRQFVSVGSTIVDSPSVFYFANNSNSLYTGQLNAGKASIFKFPSNTFTRADKISDSVVVMRVLDSSLQKQTFQTINILSSKVLAQADIIKEQQQLGGFEYDGWLQYNKSLNKIFFVEMYRNRFFCLDTNLAVVYEANTIDTVRTNNIQTKLTSFDGEQRIMPSSTRIVTNADIVMNETYLFVLSDLKADNESMSTFRNNAAVDIYRLSNGAYKGSFYLPRNHNNSISSMAVAGSTLIVLQKDQIISYQLAL